MTDGKAPWPKRAIKYWTRVEWCGLDYYRQHRARIRLLWQFDPLFWIRVLLIGSSYSLAVALWWPNEMFSKAAGYYYIRQIVHENVLGTIFLLHGLGLHWRLYARKRRFAWTAALGVIGMIAYFGVPICVFMDLGQLTMAGISMMWMGVGCWIIVNKGPQYQGAE